jgi:prolyl-tRNA synthetase
MRYSKLFGKTQKNSPKDATLTSHKLLYQAGFIRESSAGRYYYLPLGIRVKEKIMKIVEEEMDRAGGQKMIIPILQPLEVWKETNRDKSGGYELTVVKDRNGAEFTLGGTGEEMFAHIVRMFHLSYRDLPMNIYQFGHKFRDELRARGGLLRLREFTMKDAYSFDVDEENFKQEYKNMWSTYERCFKRMALHADPVLADNGYYGGDYAHEFIVESKVGESSYFVSEDGQYIAHEDVATFERDEINLTEEMKDFQIIEQPEWVQTMEDNMKHYKLPKSHFLKNVVYKNRVTGEIIIATMRGDLEVNKNKLERVLKMEGLLDDATDEDLASIGTKTGYVHAWGHTGATYVGDLSLRSVRNFIGGQKEEKTDSVNVNYGRDFEHAITADIALAKEGYRTEDGTSTLIMKRGIEVGNLFNLGCYYSSKMEGVQYTDASGEKKPYYMGSYGIGIDRTLATIVEIHHDDRGIIWPESVSPYAVHLVDIQESEKGLQVYEKLVSSGIDVLWDDRDVRAGVKFADADLIGIPVRLVVSAKTGDNIEWKNRNKQESELVNISEVVKKITQEIKSQK